jgi:hypothetical protein
MNMNLATAKGSYSQKDNLLLIETEIYGFHGLFIPFYAVVPILYVIGMASLLSPTTLPHRGLSFHL